MDRFPVFSWVKGDIYSFGSLRKSYPQSLVQRGRIRQCFFPFTWRRKQIQFPKRCAIHLFRISDDRQSLQTQWFWVLCIFIRILYILLLAYCNLQEFLTLQTLYILLLAYCNLHESFTLQTFYILLLTYCNLQESFTLQTFYIPLLTYCNLQESFTLQTFYILLLAYCNLQESSED
jgi:hypothetical protein